MAIGGAGAAATEDDGYTIRPARPDEYAALPAIERAAATLFRATAFPEMADAPLASEEADPARDRVWLAVSPAGEPVGFGIVHPLGDALHLHALDVHPAHARRGLGRRLIAAITAQARAEGRRAVTLTTFRAIPWNAPYYDRLGFRPLTADGLSAALADILRAEVAAGLPGDARVAMALDLSGNMGEGAIGASPPTD